MNPLVKRSFITTIQLIADILSFNNNQVELSKHIKLTPVNWDDVVIISSKQLMLPALYCQLKNKGLLPLIPVDLNIYLKEITDINRGRNENLLKEAHEISRIFNNENIEHVFIKGIALLAGQTFSDYAERMIGDIDILVAQNQLDLSFDILTKYGYTDIVSSILERKNRRHLPRQVSRQKFGAIELHSEILIQKYKHLISSKQVLKNKRIIDGFAVPSEEDSVKISILSLQINDKAHLYGFLGFKTIYDCLTLNLPTDQTLLKKLSDEKHSESFLQLSSTFFKELTPYKTSYYSTFSKHYFIFRLNHPKWGRLIRSLETTSIGIYSRLVLLATNKSYRRHILKNKILKKRKNQL